MIHIQLTSEVYTTVDDADVLLVSGFPWKLIQPKGEEYASYAHAWNHNMSLYMHRLIAGAGPNEQVDHWDRNGLNNQKFNLRLTDSSHNHGNTVCERKANRTSQYKGVYWDKARSKWGATIHFNGKTRALGRFEDETDAAHAYDSAAEFTWGEFARLNFPVLNGVVSLEDLL